MVTQPGWVTVVVPVIVRLDPGSYTIISHVLFDGREGVNNTVVKWSVAQAVTRYVASEKGREGGRRSSLINQIPAAIFLFESRHSSLILFFLSLPCPLR